MPEPFKSLLGPPAVAAIGAALGRIDPGFDRAGFEAAALTGLEALELKARSDAIARALEPRLPAGFEDACALMVAALHPEDDPAPEGMAGPDAAGLRGWPVMPLGEIVATRALPRLDRALDPAMAALGEMTKRFTAEFAVRPLIAAAPGPAMARMRDLARSSNRHLRRLASEGSRPRLPWGMRLRAFVDDPGPVLEIAGILRDDPEPYVRRSVANALNDVSKDHPDRVAALAADWLQDAGEPRRRLVRHACRTLVKAGHRGALAALGHGPARLALERLKVATPVVRFGSALAFEAVLRNVGDATAEVVLDYAVHHRKADGRLAPKVFKGRVLRLEPSARATFARRHPMRPITTRAYRDGPHRLEIVANGVLLGAADFVLVGTGA